MNRSSKMESIKYPVSELVLNAHSAVYHLGLKPENLALKIILVGDQDRVGMISAFFDEITHQSKHREFVCHTGNFQGKNISVISTGIGTDNIDIVLNELDALVNIDLTNRIDKETKTKLEIVRIGTCGILQEEIPVHSYILSQAAIGLDNIPHFYQVPFSTNSLQTSQHFHQHVGFPASVQPYYIDADLELVNKLKSEQTFSGITVTSSGFYAPQGRKLRLKLSTENMNEQIQSFEANHMQVLNFEMESSALFFLSSALGHQATTICLGIANRARMEFSKGYEKEMNELIRYVLERI